MANEQNLKKSTPSEARANGRKGGVASGKARREKKTMQKILDELLDMPVADMQQVTKLAAKLGIERTKSVKELFTVVAMLNSLKTAKLDDLEKIARLLGEQTAVNDAETDAQKKFLAAVRKAVTDAD